MKRISPPLTAMVVASLATLHAAAPPPPNFVIILGEGHGWSSTSVRMDDAVPASKSSVARTPNIENLARGGMRFASFYASSPRCTPTRAAFFTGKSPAALHMTFVGEGKRESGASPNGRVVAPTATMELPAGEATVAGLLKSAGYATAHFGKWHVGRVSPSHHGFDESDGATNNGGPDNVANPHPKQLFGMTGRGMDFMARQVKANKPFYETGNLTLFDIAKDPGERRNLAREMPGKAGELNRRLTDYLASINAQMPKPNPDYDPNKPTEVKRGGGKRKEKP